MFSFRRCFFRVAYILEESLFLSWILCLKHENYWGNINLFSLSHCEWIIRYAGLLTGYLAALSLYKFVTYLFAQTRIWPNSLGITLPTGRRVHANTYDVRGRTCFGPGPVTVIEYFMEHICVSRACLCRKEKITCSCTRLMLVTQSGSGAKSADMIFLGDFRSCLFRK